jgi:hypothetical protein
MMHKWVTKDSTIACIVPIAVVQHNNIRARKIDSQTTCSCSQQEDKLLASRSVILVDRTDTIFVRCTSVDTTIS